MFPEVEGSALVSVLKATYTRCAWDRKDEIIIVKLGRVQCT